MKEHLCVIVLLIIYCNATNSSINILTTLDYTSLQVSTRFYPRNFAGVSIDFSQIYQTAMNSTLFQGYFSNSKSYGSSNSQFSVGLKFPKGYKYNCSAYTSNGLNATCVYSYSPIMTRISTFCKNTAPTSSQNLIYGFDMEGANFSNSNFASYFASFVSTVINTVGQSYYYVPIELFDGADTFTANNIFPNYTAQSYMNDMKGAMSAYPSSYYYGPGITEYADPSWLQTYNTFQPDYSYTFSVKCVVFKNTANITIADILDEKNYRDYLIKRFTTSSGVTLNPQKASIVISQIKLTDGNGTNGITNTFASALWAIDTSIEFALFGGANIKFGVDLNADNYHSVLGPAPGYAPNPIYYGLLFLTMFSYITPVIGRPITIPGSSSNIKAYGMSIQNQLQIVLLNKDTNPNASGVVQILIKANDNIQCLYLTGSSLDATTNITWAGFTFIGGNSTPQGTYKVASNRPTSEGVYNIPLAYAQAAICYLGNPDSAFTVGVTAHQPFKLPFIIAVILLSFLS